VAKKAEKLLSIFHAANTIEVIANEWISKRTYGLPSIELQMMN